MRKEKCNIFRYFCLAIIVEGWDLTLTVVGLGVASVAAVVASHKLAEPLSFPFCVKMDSSRL
jgi:hypothetical protein